MKYIHVLLVSICWVFISTSVFAEDAYDKIKKFITEECKMTIKNVPSHNEAVEKTQSKSEKECSIDCIEVTGKKHDTLYILFHHTKDSLPHIETLYARPVNNAKSFKDDEIDFYSSEEEGSAIKPKDTECIISSNSGWLGEYGASVSLGNNNFKKSLELLIKSPKMVGELLKNCKNTLKGTTTLNTWEQQIEQQYAVLGLEQLKESHKEETPKEHNEQPTENLTSSVKQYHIFGLSLEQPIPKLKDKDLDTKQPRSGDNTEEPSEPSLLKKVKQENIDPITKE